MIFLKVKEKRRKIILKNRQSPSSPFDLNRVLHYHISIKNIQRSRRVKSGGKILLGIEIIF